MSTGRAIDTIKHSVELSFISLNQSGLASDRKIVFIDKNMDLFLTPVHRLDLVKLSTITDTAIWSESQDILAAISDSKLLVWYYPNVVYVDKDLLPRTRIASDAFKSSFGILPQLVGFSAARILVRRIDGALVSAMVSPYISQLHTYCSAVQFVKAVRLCRFVKDPYLWTSLAAFALNSGDLDTTELCFSAIDEVEKLQYIQHIKTIPSQEGRSAALALYRRRPDQAESILLSAQPPLVWRAISMHISLHKYDRALEIAQQYKSHVDTVCQFRSNYLARFNRKETSPKFIALANTLVDDETIQKRV